MPTVLADDHAQILRIEPSLLEHIEEGPKARRRPGRVVSESPLPKATKAQQEALDKLLEGHIIATTVLRFHSCTPEVLSRALRRSPNTIRGLLSDEAEDGLPAKGALPAYVIQILLGIASKTLGLPTSYRRSRHNIAALDPVYHFEFGDPFAEFAAEMAARARGERYVRSDYYPSWVGPGETDQFEMLRKLHAKFCKNYEIWMNKGSDVDGEYSGGDLI